MDELEAIQIVAFSLVAKSRRGEPTESSYVYRQIFRWFSSKYSTPLHLVYELPTYEVLQAFYEDRFESMDDDALENERLELIKSDKDREAEARERALEDIDGLAMAKEAEALADMSVDTLTKAADKFTGALNRFKDKLPQMTKESTIETGGVKTVLPPDIKMEFVDSLDDLDEDSIGMLDKPKSS